MSPIDRPAFGKLLAGCLEAIYEKTVSPIMLDVWFHALAHYELGAIATAFGRHVTDPDRGMFAPKPADVVRALEGTHEARALAAWTSVDTAIRSIGSWRSVCFDDPRIHLVVRDMGGWIGLCESDERELVFRAKEFSKRYQNLRAESIRTWPAYLIGRAEAENRPNGWPADPPLFIGVPGNAYRVLTEGDIPVIEPAIPTVGALLERMVPALREEAPA